MSTRSRDFWKRWFTALISAVIAAVIVPSFLMIFYAGKMDQRMEVNEKAIIRERDRNDVQDERMERMLQYLIERQGGGG